MLKISNKSITKSLMPLIQKNCLILDSFMMFRKRLILCLSIEYVTSMLLIIIGL